MELNVSPNYITYISYIMLTDLIMSLTTENYFHWDYFQSFVINVVFIQIRPEQADPRVPAGDGQLAGEEDL